MKTMGLSRLVLVAPERAPNLESWALAAGADDVLNDASTVATLAEAALAAGRHGADRHSVALANGRHVRARAVDDADTLVTEDAPLG